MLKAVGKTASTGIANAVAIEMKFSKIPAVSEAIIEPAGAIIADHILIEIECLQTGAVPKRLRKPTCVVIVPSKSTVEPNLDAGKGFTKVALVIVLD